MATAAASKSKWLTNFDEMLAEVGCFNGPKQCGAENHLAQQGEECGPFRGCYTPKDFDHELCIDVAQWQCFKDCPEGQALDPLSYCKCVDDA